MPLLRLLKDLRIQPKGIHNNFSNDEKPNDTRERMPRTFYGPENFFKEFSDTDATAF